VQHANCPAKSYYFTATREAGLVQIALALNESRARFSAVDTNGDLAAMEMKRQGGDNRRDCARIEEGTFARRTLFRASARV
jgi:hypothetical protein